MERNQIEELARRVDEAARERRSIVKLSDTVALDVPTAYRVQRASMARRFERGERKIGMKMGLTSRAKMEQMGVDAPIYGHLSDAMRLEDGAMIPMARLIHPRVEPEIGFVMGEALSGSVRVEEAMRAVVEIVVALEVIDSRYENFRFTLPDVIADNASSSFFAIAEQGVTPDHDLDLANLGITLEINGEARQHGSSAAILGNPALALVELSRLLGEQGERLEPGDVVLAGAATAAEFIESGDQIAARCDGLGVVRLSASAPSA